MPGGEGVPEVVPVKKRLDDSILDGTLEGSGSKD